MVTRMVSNVDLFLQDPSRCLDFLTFSSPEPCSVLLKIRMPGVLFGCYFYEWAPCCCILLSAQLYAFLGIFPSGMLMLFNRNVNPALSKHTA